MKVVVFNLDKKLVLVTSNRNGSKNKQKRKKYKGEGGYVAVSDNASVDVPTSITTNSI